LNEEDLHSKSLKGDLNLNARRVLPTEIQALPSPKNRLKNQAYTFEFEIK
jgi:hypothetical protein